MDVVDQQTRSRMMAGIRGHNTSPEKQVRSYLHAQGFRFRLHRRDLPGTPDIVLPRHGVAILVHGCFWHRHAGCRLTTTPSTNAERWQAKFDANVERDRRNEVALAEKGWRIAILWECGLRDNTHSLEWLPDWIRGGGNFVEWPSLEDVHNPHP
jgi:DNA mismatch endonuclease (patch repair protein)